MKKMNYYTLILSLFILMGLFPVDVKANTMDENNDTNIIFQTSISMKPDAAYYDEWTEKTFVPTKAEKRDAKKLYHTLCFLKRNQKIRVTTKDYKHLSHVVSIMDKDYFYFTRDDGGSTCQTGVHGLEYIVFKGKNTKPAIKRELFCKRRITRMLKDAGVKKGMSVYDTIIRINNYIINYYEYDYSYKQRDLFEILNSDVIVCSGYSTLFQAMTKYCGINTGFMELMTKDNQLHAINIIQINGVNTYIDCTWNDMPNKDYRNMYLFMNETRLRNVYGTITGIEW